MFEITRKNDLEKLAFIELNDHIELKDLLSHNLKKKTIVLCPTHAIDIKKETIEIEKCISCGICKQKYPQVVNFDSSTDDIKKFLKFCNQNKMFIYTWLSLILTNNSGVNITIKGYSRTKRVPLVIVENNTIFFIKCERSIKEVEYGYYELEDMCSLATEDIKTLKIKKIILLIEKPKKTVNLQFKDCNFIYLEDLYSKCIIKHMNEFTKLI